MLAIGWVSLSVLRAWPPQTSFAHLLGPFCIGKARHPNSSFASHLVKSSEKSWNFDIVIGILWRWNPQRLECSYLDFHIWIMLNQLKLHILASLLNSNQIPPWIPLKKRGKIAVHLFYMLPSRACSIINLTKVKYQNLLYTIISTKPNQHPKQRLVSFPDFRFIYKRHLQVLWLLIFLLLIVFLSTGQRLSCSFHRFM